MVGTLQKLTQDQVDHAIEMYQSGMSLKPIAEYYGVSRQSMWGVLKRRITLRPQKRTGLDNHFFRGGASSDGHANNMLEYALRKGYVKKKHVCEECGDSGTFKDGRSKIQAHHSDYNKPLDVDWLCQECHHEWHKNNTPKKKI